MKYFLIIVFVSLTACSSNLDEKYSNKKSSWQKFTARNEESDLFKPFIYQAFTPNSWKRVDSLLEESITDTKKPICEYQIFDEEEVLHLFVHTFPFNRSQMRIPCQAQITRWKSQFEELNPLYTEVVNESHSGFCGMKLEAQGIYKQKECKMIAWSMQLANEHERELNLSPQLIDQYKLADYTIKVVGSPDLIDNQINAIQRFAESFEFIEELNTNL